MIITTEENIKNHIDTLLKNKKLALGWNRNIFKYDNMKIEFKTEDKIEVTLLYTEDNNKQLVTIVELDINSLVK